MLVISMYNRLGTNKYYFFAVYDLLLLCNFIEDLDIYLLIGKVLVNIMQHYTCD